MCGKKILLIPVVVMMVLPAIASLPDGCHLKSSRCAEAGETRLIDHVPVYQACWREVLTYQCPDQDLVKNSCDHEINCKPLAKAVALDAWHSQLAMRCTEIQSSRQCIDWETRQDCRQQPVSYTHGQDNFTTTANNNFDHAMAQLALLDSLQQSMQQNPLSVFAGDAMLCEKPLEPLTMDCCDPQLGKDNAEWYISHCGKIANDLAMARRENRTHEVGAWCAHYMPWPMENTCVEMHQTACRFNSVLMRLVQEQGREQINRLALEKTAIITKPLSWVFALKAEKSGISTEATVIETPFNITLRPYRIADEKAGYFHLQYRFRESGQWQTSAQVMPFAIPENAPVTIISDPLLNWYGHCQQDSGVCQFYLQRHVTVKPLSWGAPQQPDCRGLTPEELQLIDFDQIDFSEWQAQQAKSSVLNPALNPTPSAINQQQVMTVTQDLNALSHRVTSYGKAGEY